MWRLIAVGLGMLVAIGSVTPAVAKDCDTSGWIGSCSVSNPGDRVDVSGTKTTPGGSTHDGGTGSPTRKPATPGAPAEGCGLCRGDYEVGSLPDVTIADLASFVPTRPRLAGEPSGAAVVGMPANLVAAASEQRIAGTLFDYDVVVRFVPASFRFEYGDGSSRTTSTGGATWARLGQPDFSPTDTSHVYRARGTYAVSVTLSYAASVDFGSGEWRPVPGFVTATTGGYSVRAVEVHTALVARTCLENPRGPGC